MFQSFISESTAFTQSCVRGSELEKHVDEEEDQHDQLYDIVIFWNPYFESSVLLTFQEVFSANHFDLNWFNQETQYLS